VSRTRSASGPNAWSCSAAGTSSEHYPPEQLSPLCGERRRGRSCHATAAGRRLPRRPTTRKPARRGASGSRVLGEDARLDRQMPAASVLSTSASMSARPMRRACSRRRRPRLDDRRSTVSRRRPAHDLAIGDRDEACPGRRPAPHSMSELRLESRSRSQSPRHR
jgi:hypothetical protein